MGSEWESFTVSELQAQNVLLVEDGNHGEYRPRSNEFTDIGSAFIRAADLDNGEVLFEKAEKINHTALARIRKGIGSPRDVLLSHKGTVGKVAIAPADAPSFVCSPQTTFWRSLNEDVLDQRFIFHFLRSSSFRLQLDSRKGETDMADYVSLTAQRQLKVPVPPIQEQRAISDVLSGLDDKIRLNRRMNATLEAMAQALFKSWFVDFDPVKAKAAGRAPERMDADTAAIFPGEFQDSELRLIPKGWEVKSLDQIATFLNGLALQKYPPESEEEFLPIIKIAQLRKGDTEGSDKASRNLSPEYIVKDGDLLFSWSGSLEVVFWCGGEGALNQHLFKVFSSAYPRWLYYCWTKHHLPSFREIAAHKATTMGHIQRRHLTEAKVIVPPSANLEKLTKLFEPLISKQISNAIEERKLTEIRDALLPKLISGQLRIPGIEEAQGGVE